MDYSLLILIDLWDTAITSVSGMSIDLVGKVVNVCFDACFSLVLMRTWCDRLFDGAWMRYLLSHQLD